MYWPVASRSGAALTVSGDSARAWKAGGTTEATMPDVIKPRSFFVFICAPPCCCRVLRSRCELLRGGAASHGADVVDKQHCGFKLVNAGNAPRKPVFLATVDAGATFAPPPPALGCRATNRPGPPLRHVQLRARDDRASAAR